MYRYISKKVKNQKVCSLAREHCTFMKSETTLDDTARMDSLFTMSIHTPRRYILELLFIQSAHTFWEAQRYSTKISVACTVIDHSRSCN